MTARPIVAVGVLLLHDDKVLLVQRAKPPQVGRWTIPGGKVELGESLEAAVLRELEEETGLSCTLGPLVEILDRIVRDDAGEVTFHYVILDWLGSDPRGTLRAASDSLDARWVALDELGDYELTDGLDVLVARVQTSVGSVVPHRVSEELREQDSPRRT